MRVLRDQKCACGRHGLWRSRWAAIGAAVAVAVGGGGLYVLHAATPPSEFVAVTPTRVLDTRTGLGLVGKFVTEQPRLLTVTGVVATLAGGVEVVPVGATGVVLNVTVVGPSAGGFVSVRPGDATGSPLTSNLNFDAGVVVPNSVTVSLPAAGSINLFYFGGAPGATSDMLIDIVGYYGGGTTISLGATPSLGRQVVFSTSPDTVGNVGLYPSITVGVDGLPIIAHNDFTNGDLRMTHCNDLACTIVTSTAVDTANSVGFDPSITIGVDGLAIIAHQDQTSGGDLRVTHCSNVACTTATHTSVDTANVVGQSPSITIGVDGLAIIAHRDQTNFVLRVTHCSNVACTSATSTSVDSVGSVGLEPSITIGVDGFPIIAHSDTTDFGSDLRVTHCSNVACTSATSTSVDTVNQVGRAPSITIGVDGLAIIAHNDNTNGDLRVTHCSNVACTTVTNTSVDTINSVGASPSIAIGVDGLAIIAHRDSTNLDLRVTQCTNVPCTTATTTSVDTVNQPGGAPSITIGSDSQPIIAHQDSATIDLRVTKLQHMSWTRNGWGT